MFSAKEISKYTSKPATKGGIFFQPKLTVNQPGDRYEQEADRMADQVMRMAAPGDAIQRKCKHCEEEEKKEVQRKESSSAAPETDIGFEQYVTGLGTQGRVLPSDTRSFFEPRFGYDFSNVRVHTGSDAAQSARSINALAYTTGNNIVFDSGQYDPYSASGKRLLAHELTHVVQQQSAPRRQAVQRTSARQVACSPGPFTSSGGTVIADPVAFITEAEARGSELIARAVADLVAVKDEIDKGSEPAWPVIGDTVGFALTLLGLNPGNRNTWVKTGIGTVSLLIRRLRAFQATLTGTGMFYYCDPQRNVNMLPCAADTCRGGGADAFACAGSFRIALCDPFWSQGSLEERAVILIHEHAHNFADFIGDSGTQGNAECYARFVIEANGLTSSGQSAALCPNP